MAIVKLTRLDLDYILQQIQMAEDGQTPVNPLLSFGLRTVQGIDNNLSAGGALFGSAFQAFPALTDQMFRPAQFGTNYAQTSGFVVDLQPRTISLLIAAQNAVAGPGADGVVGTPDDTFVSGNAAAFAAQQRALGLLGPGYQKHDAARSRWHLRHGGRQADAVRRPRRGDGHNGRHLHVRQPSYADQGLQQQFDDPGSAAEPVHSERDTGQRTVGAVQQLLHDLRPVLRPRPRPDHQERADQRLRLYPAAAGRPPLRAGQPKQLHDPGSRAAAARSRRPSRNR